MSSPIDTSGWNKAQLTLWNGLPEAKRSEIARGGPEKALAWLEKQLNREIDKRGTVGAGKMIGRQDKLIPPNATSVQTMQRTSATTPIKLSQRGPLPPPFATLEGSRLSAQQGPTARPRGRFPMKAPPPQSTTSQPSSQARRRPAPSLVREQATVQQERPIEQAQQNFQQQTRDFASRDPEGFREVLQQAYGDKVDGGRLDELANQARQGNLPTPGDVRFVDDGTLQGANAAYSPEDGGTIYLNERLRDHPEALQSAFAEEMGHHLDHTLGGADSMGDEGEIFQRGLANGGPLREAELSEARVDRDTGTLTIGDRQVHVEFQRGLSAEPNNRSGRRGRNTLDALAERAEATNIDNSRHRHPSFGDNLIDDNGEVTEQGRTNADRVRDIYSEANELENSGEYGRAADRLRDLDNSNLRDAAYAMRAIGPNGQLATRTAIQQLEFCQSMTDAGITGVSNPPSESQLREYFGNFNPENNPDANREDALRAYEGYAQAFHCHIADYTGNDDSGVTYLENSTEYYLATEEDGRRVLVRGSFQRAQNVAEEHNLTLEEENGSPSFTTTRQPDSWEDITRGRNRELRENDEVNEDLNDVAGINDRGVGQHAGKYINDCEGFAYMAETLLGEAGYDVDPVVGMAQGSRNDQGHAMTRIYDRETGALYVSSNEEVFGLDDEHVGDSEEDLLNAGWRHAAGRAEVENFYTQSELDRAIAAAAFDMDFARMEFNPDGEPIR